MLYAVAVKVEALGACPAAALPGVPGGCPTRDALLRGRHIIHGQAAETTLKADGRTREPHRPRLRILAGMAAPIRIGTCSWADEALSKYWYPKGVPAGRAACATTRSTSTWSRSTRPTTACPREEMVERWAERTPDGFVMHVKAFGVMTRPPGEGRAAPARPARRRAEDERGRVDRPPREFRAEVFRRFLEALEPLRSAGKLGGLLFQFPPYVVPKEASFDYLAWAREQLGGDEMLVEFRHRSWLEEEQRDETLRFLEEHRHEPRRRRRAALGRQERARSTVLALTTPLLYVRLHGRNAETWNVARQERGGAVRLPLLRGGARRVGRAAAGALTAGRAGLRALQQQQPEPRRRPRGRPGADERRDAAGPALEKEAFRSAGRAQELEQRLVEAPGCVDADDVPRALEDVQAAVGVDRRSHGPRRPGEDRPVADDDNDAALEGAR